MKISKDPRDVHGFLNYLLYRKRPVVMLNGRVLEHFLRADDVAGSVDRIMVLDGRVLRLLDHTIAVETLTGQVSILPPPEGL